MTPESRRVTLAIMWLALAGVCAAVLSLAGVYLYLDPQVPKAETYRHVKLETPLRVYTADRQLVAEFGERRLIPISLDDVPAQFVSALLDTEDKRFYEHSGIDYISLVNDAFALLWNRQITSGASTITMQLARNISFSLEQTFIRKFKEMLLALKLERELSKDEILELYINVVPFGKRAYGAQAAALTYYGKPLAELSLAQLAMLAGIPQAPTAGNPINGPERALRRRNVVLRRMLDQESITPAEYEHAVAAPITARLYQRDLDVAAPFPGEWVRSQLIERFPDLYTGGYEVITTLRGDLQRSAREALRKGLRAYDERHGYRGPEQRFDDPGSDEALGALAGARSYAGLRPALVESVDAEAAQVRLGDDRRVTVTLEDVTWARPYIDVDRRGPRPQQVGDVLATGDLIRVERLPAAAPAEADSGEDDGADADGSAADDAGPQPAPATDRWRLAQLPDIQGALVSLDPDTGAVLALEGGFDFSLNQFNHALQAARQPGSGFKPFIYSAALHHGVTPASVFLDAPLVFEDENLETEYRPDNDNNRYNGPTRLREALYRSINLVSMRVLLDVGAGNVLDYVQRFGFDTASFPRNTQLAVGGGTMAVTPLDMATAYAVFANGGYLIQPHILDRVIDIDGNTVFTGRYPQVCPEPCAEAQATTEDPAMAEPSSLEELLAGVDGQTADGATGTDATAPLQPAPRVIDERNAYIMHTMLQDVIRRGTGIRAWRALQRRDIAGKTGTTNDAADTWFNGYSDEVATTVWVGFPNYGPLGSREYGSNTPLPIWIDYMSTALAGRPEHSRTQPPGLITMRIDPENGELAAARQEDAILELFLAEHAPRQDVEEALVRDAQPAEDDLKAVDIF